MAVQLWQRIGLIDRFESEVGEREGHGGTGSRHEVIEAQEEGIGKVLEDPGHLAVIAASSPVGEDARRRQQAHGIGILGKALVLGAKALGEVELLPSSGHLECMVRACSLSGVTHHHDHPQRGVVAPERLEASGDVHVRRCGIEQHGSGLTGREQRVERGRIRAVILDLGEVEQMRLLPLGEAHVRVLIEGRRER